MTDPQLLADDQFASVRELLRSAGFTVDALRARFGITTLEEFVPLSKQAQPEIGDGLELLVWLFIVGDYIRTEKIDLHLGPRACRVLTEVGLVGSEPERPGFCFATVALYPVQGFWITSDRLSNPDRSPFTPAADAVYPAFIVTTQQFMAGLPENPCESFLDLCAGTGVAALRASSHYAAHAWSCDITERATRFAEFNRRLNGISNFTAARGDLYKPVEGKTFDRIVAHPPYVPAVETQFVYRDGGEDGEQITRRIIEGLPGHLRLGGRFYCLALGTDRSGATFDQRVRQWLGERESEFDLLLGASWVSAPMEFCALELRKGFSERPFQLHEMLTRLGVTAVFHGFIVIQRHEKPRRPFTVRRILAASRNPRAALEWLLDWETTAATGDIASLLLDSRPAPSPYLRLTIEHQMHQGELQPSRFGLDVSYPFVTKCNAEPWMAMLAGLADGAKTGRDLFQQLKERGLLLEHAAPEEFARALAPLLGGGFLEIEGFRPPREGE